MLGAVLRAVSVYLIKKHMETWISTNGNTDQFLSFSLMFIYTKLQQNASRTNQLSSLFIRLLQFYDPSSFSWGKKNTALYLFFFFLKRHFWKTICSSSNDILSWWKCVLEYPSLFFCSVPVLVHLQKDEVFPSTALQQLHQTARTIYRAWRWLELRGRCHLEDRSTLRK